MGTLTSGKIYNQKTKDKLTLGFCEFIQNLDVEKDKFSGLAGWCRDQGKRIYATQFAYLLKGICFITCSSLLQVNLYFIVLFLLAVRSCSNAAFNLFDGFLPTNTTFRAGLKGVVLCLAYQNSRNSSAVQEVIDLCIVSEANADTVRWFIFSLAILKILCFSCSGVRFTNFNSFC